MAGIDSAITRQSFLPGKLHANSKQLQKIDEKAVNFKNNLDHTLSDESILPEDESMLQFLPETSHEELASLITVFQQRREWERKKAIGNNDASFDQILEEGDTQDKINQFFKLISTDVSANLKKFFIYLQRFFSDESDMYLVLEALLRKKNLTDLLKAKLKNAITYLEETTDAKKLKSGINIAFKARCFSSKLKIKPAIVRRSYRQFLEDENEVLDIYYSWIIEFGYSKRDIILEFMENALLTDMMSLDPSCSKYEYGNLLARIRQLNILHSTAVILSDSVKKNRLLVELNDNPSLWFQFFYYCIKNPQSLQDEIMLLSGAKFKFLSHYERGAVLQIISQLFALIPMEIFGEIRYKDKLKDILVTLSDISFKQQKHEK